MMEWIETQPAVNVAPAEYARLLGYPPGVELSEPVRDLAEMARDWYAAHGSPWIYARQASGIAAADGAVHIEGTAFSIPRFTPAEGALLVAVGAGPELEEEARRRWAVDKPDEYFFLDVYGSAVVEHLIAQAGHRLCEWADGRKLFVLPHRSPGYPGWDVSEQPRLLELLGPNLPQPLEALSSGAMRPTKSQLAVFGFTAAEGARVLPEVPCASCALAGCQFRRPMPKYNVRTKALERWATDRLTLSRRADGSIHALFRYDGTTCSNMGRPLTFEYKVELGPRDRGYPIVSQSCHPAAADTGHVHMCEYIKSGGALMESIAAERPLAGQPLDAVLAWSRAMSPAGCYCDAASREHKWGLVLETIHYALSNRT